MGAISIAFVFALSAALVSCENPLAEVAASLRSKAASPTIAVSVEGAAIPSGGAVDLGSILAATTYAATVTVSNSGATALVIDPSSIALSMSGGTPAGAFSVDASSFSGSIEPGATDSFSIRFTPPAAADYSATLAIPSNDINTGGYSCALTGKGLSTPNAPTGIGASSGDTQATIVWNAVAGAESYNLYFSTASGSGKSGTKVAGVSSPYTLTGLVNGSAYYCVLTTVSSGIESAASTQAQVTPQVTASGAPTGVTAVAGTMKATVTWTAVAGATGYNLYYMAGGVPTKASYGAKLEGVSSGLIIKELDPSATYFFVVTALNPSESECSNSAAAKPLATPYPPTISASTLGTDSIRVTADLNDYATGYTLYYSTSSSVSTSSYQGSSTVYATGADTVAFDVAGLSAGTTYYFVMSSANGAYVSGASNRASALTNLVTPTITANSILVDNGTVYLPWTASGNGSAVTYTVLRSTDGVSYSAAASGIASLYYLNSGLTNWATHYFKVMAVADDSATTAESAAVSAMPVHQALAVLNFNSDSLDINLIQSPAYSASRLAAGTWYHAGQVTSGALVGDGPSSLVQHPSMGYIYEGNSGPPTTSLGVYAYSINASGLVTAIVDGENNGVYHEALALATKGGTHYVYAADKGSTGIYVYQVAASGGGLTQVADAVASAAGSDLRALSVTPDSKYLYVSSMTGNVVSAYGIGSDGKLNKIADYGSGLNQPYKSAVSPDGKYFYVANWGAAKFTAYSIDADTGALTLIGTYPVGANPTSVAVDATSSYVYVACGSANTVYSFSIGSGGALSQIGSALSTGLYPNHLSIDYGNQCLAVACANSNFVALYSIDRASGALTHSINVGTAIYPGFATWIKLP